MGFGSTFKALFPASRSYCEVGEGLGEGLQGSGLSRLLALLLLWQESLAVACESLRRMRADMGSTNVLSPLRWVVRQPIPRGHPQLLFLLTAGAVGDTGKVLEVLRNHSSSTRYGGPAARRAKSLAPAGWAAPRAQGAVGLRGTDIPASGTEAGLRAAAASHGRNLKGFGTDPRSSDAF